MSKNRLARQRKPVDRSKKRLKLATVDIETHDWVKTVCIGFYDGRTFETYSNYSELIDRLRNNRFRAFLIYAHNGGKFDFLPIIDECAEQGLRYSLVEIGSRIAEIKIYFSKKHKVTLRDSICLLNNSLKKLTESFKTETQKLELNHKKEKFDPKNPIHIEYLKNDCIGLYQVLQKFFNTEKINTVKPKLTLSSTAMAIHRTTYKNPIPMTSQRVQNFIREGYAGGRCEIFKHEAYDFSCYDINSLYPFCMGTKAIPLRHIGASRSPEDFGFHRIKITVPDHAIPVLPVRLNNRLIFPTGTFSGIYFSDEIQLAIRMGARVLRFYVGEKFQADTEFFRAYTDHFYRLRLASKGFAADYIAKLLLNGLYGKYAQREERESLVYDDGRREGEIYGSDEIYAKYRLLKVREFKRQDFMLVHIAAAITAYGRIELYEKGLLGNDPIYCDTDSVFTSNLLPTGNNMGEFKHEYSAKYGYFRLPKLYFIQQENQKIIKAKGFPQELIKNTTLAQFKKSNLYTEIEKPMTFRASLKTNQKAFSKNTFKKSIISGYTKRKVLPGGATRPWHLENGVAK